MSALLILHHPILQFLDGMPPNPARSRPASGRRYPCTDVPESAFLHRTADSIVQHRCERQGSCRPAPEPHVRFSQLYPPDHIDPECLLRAGLRVSTVHDRCDATVPDDGPNVVSIAGARAVRFERPRSPMLRQPCHVDRVIQALVQLRGQALDGAGENLSLARCHALGQSLDIVGSHSAPASASHCSSVWRLSYQLASCLPWASLRVKPCGFGPYTAAIERSIRISARRSISDRMACVKVEQEPGIGHTVRRNRLAASSNSSS